MDIPPTSSDEMESFPYRTTEEQEKIRHIFDIPITCNEGTMYPETCKFMDCKYSLYKSNAPYGCDGCQKKAEESDCGI